MCHTRHEGDKRSDLNVFRLWILTLFCYGLACPILSAILSASGAPAWPRVILSAGYFVLAAATCWTGGRHQSWRLSVSGLATLFGTGILATLLGGWLCDVHIIPLRLLREPIELLVIAIGSLAALFFLIHLLASRVPRHRNRLAPLCEHCGYCLLGLKEPRCPECGERFPPELLS